MKTIVITGVTGGLGKATALSYLRSGYRVFGWDVEDKNTDDLKAEYEDRFFFRKVDLTSTASVRVAVASVMRQTDSLDVIFNAAGILPKNSENELEDFDIDASIKVFDVNALGPLRVVKALLPLLRKGEEKVIINISSEAGSMQAHYNETNRYDYSMSKASLNIQSVILQKYLEPDGIRVFIFHPGWMHTSMGGAQAPVSPDDTIAGIRKVVSGRHDYRIQLTDYDGHIRAW